MTTENPLSYQGDGSSDSPFVPSQCYQVRKFIEDVSKIAKQRVEAGERIYLNINDYEFMIVHNEMVPNPNQLEIFFCGLDTEEGRKGIFNIANMRTAVQITQFIDAALNQ